MMAVQPLVLAVALLPTTSAGPEVSQVQRQATHQAMASLLALLTRLPAPIPQRLPMKTDVPKRIL